LLPTTKCRCVRLPDGNLEPLLWMNLVDVIHPGTSLLDVEDAPRERPCDHYIEAATDGNAVSVLGVLDRIVASLGIVWELTV